ncbi:hypothetical protein FVE85_2183 [Porphyridium purpureum]|uniref:Leishmanolysin-like peptidase n=1 Tax=Porphyridium purpureum TaxID=35688 RepID=A0A5J4YY20_PORPP|nr:hypothetical protein FVE85_2183 [Porphyridium purpureum]|eukprot:POR8420..scf209_3
MSLSSSGGRGQMEEERSSNASADTEPNASIDAEPNASADAESNASADAESNASADAESNASADAEPNASADAEPNASADAEPNASADSSANGGSTQDPRAVAVFEEALGVLNAVLVGQRLVAQPVTMQLYYRISSIDGLGGVLGSAINYQHVDVCTDSQSPCHYDVLPTLGEMVFDAADFFNNVEYAAWRDFWVQVTLHEMLHMLGVGSFWVNRFPTRAGYNTRVECVATQAASYKYPGAKREWNLLGGQGAPPVEYNHWNGDGSNCKHWDESAMNVELMTTETNTILTPTTAAVEEKLSRVTLGAMEDLNYVVDWSHAETYIVPPSRRMAELETHSHAVLESVRRQDPDYLAKLEMYEATLHKQSERAKERKHLHEELKAGVIEEVWYPENYEAPLLDRAGHILVPERVVPVHL